jgi:hypothetical protein
MVSKKISDVQQSSCSVTTVVLALCNIIAQCYFGTSLLCKYPYMYGMYIMVRMARLDTLTN